MNEFYVLVSICCAFASWFALISIAVALKLHNKAMKKHREFLMDNMK